MSAKLTNKVMNEIQLQWLADFEWRDLTPIDLLIVLGAAASMILNQVASDEMFAEFVGMLFTATNQQVVIERMPAGSESAH